MTGGILNLGTEAFENREPPIFYRSVVIFLPAQRPGDALCAPDLAAYEIAQTLSVRVLVCNKVRDNEEVADLCGQQQLQEPG